MTPLQIVGDKSVYSVPCDSYTIWGYHPVIWDTCAIPVRQFNFPTLKNLAFIRKVKLSMVHSSKAPKKLKRTGIFSEC